MFPNDRIVPPANRSTNKLRELIRASQTTPLLVDTVCILAGLALTIGVSAFLGSLGLQFGFAVAHMGEDYAWLNLLQTGNGADTASLWWAGSQRNPLAPWWHIAAKDVILGFDAGLLWLRYAMAALLALSSGSAAVGTATFRAGAVAGNAGAVAGAGATTSALEPLLIAHTAISTASSAMPMSNPRNSDAVCRVNIAQSIPPPQRTG